MNATTNATAHVMTAREYIRTAATHKYMFVVLVDGAVYIVKFDNLTSDVLVALTSLQVRATSKGGGYSLRFIRNNANRRAIVEMGEVVYKQPRKVFESYVADWKATHKGNRGDAAESFVAAKMFGITNHVKDQGSYKSGADVNGYQVKLDNASFAPQNFIMG
jgi:hypothetical protein